MKVLAICSVYPRIDSLNYKGNGFCILLNDPIISDRIFCSASEIQFLPKLVQLASQDQLLSKFILVLTLENVSKGDCIKQLVSFHLFKGPVAWPSNKAYLWQNYFSLQ